jgi:hypothetical protein
MKKVIVLLLGMMLIAGAAMAACPNDCEMFWIPVTQYTDNTAIEAADLPVSYVAEWDGVTLSSTTNTFIPIPKPYGHGVLHTLRMKARTARGAESIYSPPFSWTSPAGYPKNPAGIGVR